MLQRSSILQLKTELETRWLFHGELSVLSVSGNVGAR
jgi:hypothetical protein